MNDYEKPESNFTLAKRIAALPKEVTPMQRLFLHTLLIHRNATTGLCYPSQETIAREMGSGEATPKRKQEELVKMGYLTIGKIISESGKVNSYSLHLPDISVSSSMNSESSSADSVSSRRDLSITVIHKQNNKTNNKTDFKQSTGVAAPARKGHIEVDEVVAVGMEVGISEDYCRKWWEGFEKAGWTTTRGVPVTRRNLRSLLVKWHENDERFKRLAAQKAANKIGSVHHQEGYINPLEKGNLE